MSSTMLVVSLASNFMHRRLSVCVLLQLLQWQIEQQNFYGVICAFLFISFAGTIASTNELHMNFHFKMHKRTRTNERFAAFAIIITMYGIHELTAVETPDFNSLLCCHLLMCNMENTNEQNTPHCTQSTINPVSIRQKYTHPHRVAFITNEPLLMRKITDKNFVRSFHIIKATLITLELYFTLKFCLTSFATWMTDAECCYVMISFCVTPSLAELR